jgi:hypothetical protein
MKIIIKRGMNEWSRVKYENEMQITKSRLIKRINFTACHGLINVFMSHAFNDS